MKPLIGITAARNKPANPGAFFGAEEIFFCDTAYAAAVRRAGGLPVLLTFPDDDQDFSSYKQCLDGLLLTGGEDVHPRYARYQQTNTGFFDPERDEFEISLAKIWLSSGKPLLAICRGFQLVNVALGGSILSDIPVLTGSTHHQQRIPMNQTVHEVILDESSRTAEILGVDRLSVNSTHHQSLNRIADDLHVIGYSEEGIPEAFESERYPFLIGVQWHPEHLTDLPAHRRLFTHLVTTGKAIRDGRGKK